jgi:hypothetical protein
LCQTDQWYHHRGCLSGHYESLVYHIPTCTLIMPPVYTSVNWQWISLEETYLTKLDHLTVIAGQSFLFCCHYISSYTMNSIWLALALSVACYPPLHMLRSTKKTQYWVIQRLLSREPYLFNMLGICIWGEHGRV